MGAVTLGLRTASHAEHRSHGPLSLPLPLQRRSGRAKWVLQPPDQGKGTVADQPLVRTLVRADEWWQRLATGRTPSVDSLARQEGVSPSLVTRIVRLAFLAPDIVTAIIKGQQPPGLTARQLINGATLPLAWREQRERLGFPARPEP